MKKKVLITSGGTIIPIDDVRHIGNFSAGTFPSKLAEAALEKGHEVIFLYAKNSKTPFMSKKLISLKEAISESKELLGLRLEKIISAEKNLELVEYSTFDDYKSQLEILIKKNDLDIILLGAAVSYYGMDKVNGKISSTKDKLVIELSRNPKIIKSIKEWANRPIFQIGFKLLSNVTEEELFETAYKACLDNASNLVIANDLSKIREGKREVILVTPEKGKIKFEKPDLAEKVFDYIDSRTNATHFHTEVKISPSICDKFSKEFLTMKKIVKDLYENNLLEEFISGANLFHGSVSFRAGDGFLITARASDKRELKDEDIVFVRAIDLDNRKIFTESTKGNKPSMNALLSYLVFRDFPDQNIIIHTHKEVSGMPSTEFSYIPGTLEYSEAPLELLEKSRMVNLINHGQITIGKEVKETFEYVRKRAK